MADTTAWGDAALGELTVQIAAGDRVWGGFGATPENSIRHADMPGRWPLGDSIDSRASIIQTIPLAGVLANAFAKSPDDLFVGVDFGWNVRDAEGHSDPVQYGLFYAVGKATAPHNGLIMQAVDFSVTMSMVTAKGSVLSTQQVSANVLTVVVDATYPGVVQAKGDEGMIQYHWYFDKNWQREFLLAATIPFDKRASHLVVEASAYLFGGRASVGNKDAGWIAGIFAAPHLCQGLMALPFAVRGIAAYRH